MSKKSTKKPDNNNNTAESDKLVQIAVNFLSNPKVESTSEETKRTFLKKKGLSEENIQKAFEQYKKKKEIPKIESNVTINSEVDNKGKNSPEETIEEKIEKSKKTFFLSLRRSNIKTLNPSIFSLEMLQTLIISFNDIEIIPSEIKNLQKLKVFHAVGCKLSDSSFSTEFWTLPNLIELNISKNNLVSIANISKFKSLVRLDVSDNQILEIPDNIDEIINLETFNIRNNNISEIPINVTNLKSLKRFTVGENNLDKKIEEEIKTKGIEGLFKYLKELF